MSIEQLTRIEEKLDENTRQTLENTLSLREHMRRTELLEDMLASTSERIKPIEAHVHMMAGAFKLVVVLGTAAATIAGLLRLFNHANP